VVVACAVWLAAVNIQGSAKPGGEATSPVPSASIAPYTAAATATVHSWLDALAAGDAQSALTMMRDLPSDRTFLTDEVLRGAMPVFADVKIQPEQAAEDDVTFRLTFDMAGQEKWLQLDLANQQPGSPTGPWLIAGGTTDVDVTQIMPPTDGMNLVVNGVPVPPGASTITLLPGLYPLSVSDTRFAFAANDSTLIVPVFDPPVFNADLSADGQAQVDAAVQAKLDSCLAQTVAVPPSDCGFGFADPAAVFGKPVQIASVVWTLAPGTADAAFRYSVDPATLVARGTGHMTIHGAVTDVSGAAYAGTDAITGVTVNLTDPANPVVAFG